MSGGPTLQRAIPEPCPRFLGAASGQLFCMEYPPAAWTSGEGVLIVAPIGEEMNKCRRMMALAARALQSAGFGALYVDCHGTGDSAGDHRDATVVRWRDDLRHAAAHLLGLGAAVVHVLAIRSGALLLDAELIGDGAWGRLALWQPVLTGKQVVTQWLRLATAGEVVAGADRGGEQRVRKLLETQGYCEIAGYDVSRELVAQLGTLELRQALERPWRRISWFEVVADDAAGLSPAATRAIANAGALSSTITSQTVVGEPFWATPEIATSAALVAATRDYLVQP